MGSLERFLETFVESSLSEGSSSLILAASLGSLLLKGLGADSLAGGEGLLLGSSERLGGGVHPLHLDLVLKGVLLSLGGHIGAFLEGVELGLDLVRVNDSGEVSAGHHVSSELEAALLDSSLSVGSEDIVELLEGILGEDDESSEVTTGGELEEVESVNRADVNSGEVAGGSLDGGVLVSVHDQGSLGEGEAGASVLALAGSGSLGVADTGEVTVNTDGVEALEESGGLLGVEAVNNKGELGDVVDGVTSGHDQGSASGSGESGGNSVSLLVKVNLSVPLSPELERSEHATLTAHVTEGTLSGAVGTTTGNTRNTRHSATGTP